MNPIPFIGMASRPIAVNFDGSTTLTKSGGFSVNSKLFTCSFWAKITNTATNRILAIQTNGANDWGVTITVLTDERLAIATGSFHGANGFVLTTDSAVPIGSWFHLVLSLDLSDAGKRHCYIDGSSAAVTYTKYVDAALDYDGSGSGTNFVIGYSGPYIGDLYQFCYAPGIYVDLSVGANLQKFYNSGKVEMGTDGSLALGSTPGVFLNGRSVGRWPSNRGDGGSFTVSAGALTKSATHP